MGVVRRWWGRGETEVWVVGTYVSGRGGWVDGRGRWWGRGETEVWVVGTYVSGRGGWVVGRGGGGERLKYG